jgi:hypothetical protein
LFACPIIPFFFVWPLTFFLLRCTPSWASPISWPLGCHTLHMWPTFRFHGDSPFSLRSWWGKDDIPWCCAGTPLHLLWKMLVFMLHVSRPTFLLMKVLLR